jgi:phosphoglycolate phosphatase/pyrophosphatase PpaX
MARLRPSEQAVDLEGFFLKNFKPGFQSFLREELAFSETEMDTEYGIWREFVERGRPQFYAGFLDALEAHREQGGFFVVVSHSESDMIHRHYHATGRDLRPAAVFGWEAGEGRRKPDPWPVSETLRRFGLAPGEVLVVDDLRPGILMAQAAGVPSVAAGWAHRLPAIRTYMQANTLGILDSVEDFAAFILQS